MNQPHPLPRRSGLGVFLSLLLVIGSAIGVAGQVTRLFAEAAADPPAAPAPGAAPINGETGHQ